MVPLTTNYYGQRLFSRETGLLVATPLFAVLVLIETTDLIFAVDSIPAIFAVTHDPFIVFTSNVFAILGLRALYFLLAGVAHRFVYLKTGLAAILILVGVKMLLTDLYHVPVWGMALQRQVIRTYSDLLIGNNLGGDGRHRSGGDVGDLAVERPSL